MKSLFFVAVFLFIGAIASFSPAQDLKALMDYPVPSVGKFRQCVATIDCSALNKCLPSPEQRDSRSCRKCLLMDPILSGGCAVLGNDPVCESIKATQNAIFQAQAATRLFECEKLQTESLLSCESKKRDLLSECETTKKREIDAGTDLVSRFEKLIVLANDLRASRLDPNLNAILLEEALVMSPRLRFYEFGEDSISFKIRNFVRPRSLADSKNVPDTGVFNMTYMQTAGSVAFINTRQPLRVYDVLRAAIAASFFEKYGLDGVGQLHSSGQFDLGESIEKVVLKMCGRLRQKNPQYWCDAQVSLIPE